MINGVTRLKPFSLFASGGAEIVDLTLVVPTSRRPARRRPPDLDARGCQTSMREHMHRAATAVFSHEIEAQFLCAAGACMRANTRLSLL
eukprot:1839570-Pleurochrysis_carterae.AAC.2